MGTTDKQIDMFQKQPNETSQNLTTHEKSKKKKYLH